MQKRKKKGEKENEGRETREEEETLGPESRHSV
jgi:hypothetical protein